jgi:hypothetical protein
MLYTQITPQMAHLLMRPWHTTSNRLLSSRCSLPYTVGTLPRLRSAPGDHIQITRCRRWRICPRRALVRLLLQEVAHAADGYDLQRISLCSWSDRSKRKSCHQQSWARSGPAGETGPGIGLGRSAITASVTSYLNRFMRLLKKRCLRPHMLTAGHFILPLNLIFSFVFVVLYFVGKKRRRSRCSEGFLFFTFL